MSSSATQTTINRQQIYRKTIRILNANSLHFIPIALLFLPFTFSASAALQFYFSYSDHDVTTMFDPFNLVIVKIIIASYENALTVKTLINILAVAFFVILPTIAGIALITYSTYQAIYSRPLTFSSIGKSLFHSYIPLFSTVIAGSVKLILISLVFTLFPIAITGAIKALGFHFNLSIFSIFINTIVSYALVLTILFYIAIWGSAAAIAVLESKSGFQALRQSASQSAEFRSHSFSIVFVTAFIAGSPLVYSAVTQNFGWPTHWIWILLVGVINLQSSLMILHYVVANTVLYVQCKVAGGEEIVVKKVEEEVSGEYVRVAVNEKDDEVTQKPSGEETNGGFSYMLYLLSVVFFILFVLYNLFLLLKK